MAATKRKKLVPTLIWRIENDHGEGPYTGRFSVRGKLQDQLLKMIERHNMSAKHPLPCEDNIHWNGGIVSSDYFFGFRSVEALCEWFTWRERELLAKCKFKLVAYAASTRTLKSGRRQCAFVMDTATSLVELSPRNSIAEIQRRFEKACSPTKSC